VITLRVNSKTYQVDAEPATPLLWVLRDNIGLTGTKYGCCIAQCGAGTVHVDGRATRSCVLPVSAVLNSEITTIEGLSLDTVAQKANWGKAMPKGSAQGLAIHECFGSLVGQVAEVSVSRRGEVRVERVVCAVDCGHAVNPQTIGEQLESAVVYGLTAALYGQITIDKGRVVQSNFDDYQMLRMHQMPEVETHLALTGGEKWGGMDEPGVPPIAPAVCNAIFKITGKRIRSLPLMNHDLSWA
jgi:CO/xanthine dehydrogenase Mo-binding subunit